MDGFAHLPASAPDGWSLWPAPAKLNLFLRIVGRREDGYHLLQTVFQLLDWGDTVALRPRADGRILRHRGAVGVAPQDDLALRAAEALRRRAGSVGAGADIDLAKRIPQGGGFGGGSSDAATVLVALNHLWDLGLGEDDLAELGLTLGADVPVFVRGASAFAEGVGERLTPLALPERCYLLVDSGVQVPTAELFRAPDLTRDCPATTISGFISGSVSENVFEPVLRTRSPEIAAMLDRLGQFGRAQVTGTGGGLFVAFDHPDAAQAARQALPQGWRSWVVRGVNESPLRQRLAQDAPPG